MQTFDPVEIREFYINRIAKGISQYIDDRLFSKIFDILKDKSVINSKADLLNAIKSGRVYYSKGAFRTDTRFSNAISTELEKIGAKLRNGAYYLSENLIPIDVMQALETVKVLTSAKLFAIGQFLENFDTSVNLKPYIEISVTEMFKTLQRDILKEAETKNVPIIELGIVKPEAKIKETSKKRVNAFWEETDKKLKSLREKKKSLKGKKGKEDEIQALSAQIAEINENAYKTAPQLDYVLDDAELNAQAKEIANDYIYNMQYWVKNWEVKNISIMRKDILDMVQKGYRVPQITEYFQKRWNIAENKARFLAVNESHLAASVITKTQFKKLGATQFVWGRSSAKEKRVLHKKYYGKVFNLDDPPIIDEDLQIKGLPRQIWNCLCHMRVVVPTYTQVNNSILGKIKNAINSTKRNNQTGRYRRFDERTAL